MHILFKALKQALRKGMVFGRPFFVVLCVIFACILVSYVLIMRPGNKGNLQATGEHGDGTRSRSFDPNGLCLHGSVCKRDSGSMLLFEYRREKSFETRLRHRPKNISQAVPNIVHFAWFKGKKAYFRFHHLLSIMAVHRAMNSSVYFWFDVMPFGKTWDKVTTKLLRKIHFIHRNDTKTNLLQSVEDVESSARYEALLEFGGIAVEFDTFIMKPLNDFFDFETTVGTYPSGDLACGVIIAKPWSTLMREWYLIQMDSKTRHGTPSETFTQLALTERHAVQLGTGMVAPDNINKAYLYKEGLYFDWRKNTLCVKLWTEEHDIEHNREDIRTWNTTIGDIFRYIYFAQQGDTPA